jgi:hypothetical protein
MKKISAIIVIMCLCFAGQAWARERHEVRQQKDPYSGFVRSDDIPSITVPVPCSDIYPWLPCVKFCDIIITPEGAISNCP